MGGYPRSLLRFGQIQVSNENFANDNWWGVPKGSYNVSYKPKFQDNSKFIKGMCMKALGMLVTYVITRQLGKGI